MYNIMKMFVPVLSTSRLGRELFILKIRFYQYFKNSSALDKDFHLKSR